MLAVMTMMTMVAMMVLMAIQAIRLRMVMMVMMPMMILTKTFPFLIETQDKKKRSLLEVSMRHTPHENNGLFRLKSISTTDF